jgi:crotonobetainyl-CoA:carnitine CoA-transferase CaiB-like acyl-CoA transferase
MALMAREKTGRGQVIDAALYESAFNFMEVWIGAFQKTGFVPDRTGSRLIGSTPNNLYPTADGSYIHITAMAESLFRRLCGAMGQPELAVDPRFARHSARNENHAALDAIISDWTRQHTLADLEGRMEKVSVPATRIFTVEDIFNDPHYKARQSIVEAPDQHLGTVAMPAVVPRLSDTPGAVRHAGRDIGQDSRAVLREVLGMDDSRIDALTKEGIVAA